MVTYCYTLKTGCHNTLGSFTLNTEISRPFYIYYLLLKLSYILIYSSWLHIMELCVLVYHVEIVMVFRRFETAGFDDADGAFNA